MPQLGGGTGTGTCVAAEAVAGSLYCDLYGLWKKNLTEYDIVTQCMAHVRQPHDMYLTNGLLKINAKLGGLNTLLSVECMPAFTFISKSPKAEMIESLLKKNGTEDNGLIKELLVDFYTISGKGKPVHSIISRDGVSESQFNQVLNVELDQIIEACSLLDETWDPNFLLMVQSKVDQSMVASSSHGGIHGPRTPVLLKLKGSVANSMFSC